MNNHDYNKLAKRTLSNGFHCNPVNQVELHGAIGIVTELGEIAECVHQLPIDSVNLFEEIGDVLWYLSIFSRHYELDFDDRNKLKEQQFSTLSDVVSHSQIKSAELLDIYKKKLYYNKPITTGYVTELCYEIYLDMLNLAAFVGQDVEDIRTVNIKKLMERFPDNFTEKDAIERDLESERSILEGR